MNNRIVFIMSVCSAFVLFAAFETSFLADVAAVELLLTCVHFGHFAKLIYKIFKKGLTV